MEELLIRIEEKLRDQVNHVFKFYEDHELKQKMFDLGFEWYIKGMQDGITVARKDVEKYFDKK